MNAGDRVRRARIAAGITTAELARFVGISRERIAKRELGFTPITSVESARFLSAIETIVKMRASALKAMEDK